MPGDGGRITIADVQRAIAEKPKPMSKMRQIIAQRLTQSFRDTPHFYVTVSVDMTDLIAYRESTQGGGRAVHRHGLHLPGGRAVLAGVPGRQQQHRRQDHALAQPRQSRPRRLPRAGLVVPVIRNAGQLTLLEICQRSKQLAEKARAGKPTPDEMSGSTFTISNMGMLDVENFTAIINPGESAILAVASTMKQPVVRDDKIVVRQIMKMTLSVRPPDH